MVWVLVKPGQRLFTDFNTVFPNRDRRTDGTIGDAAHEAQVSGHNPDDTPGVIAEYGDPDTKAEVRADDVDVDLNDPRGVTLQQVMDRMISRNPLGQFNYPDDVKRLKYIIHRGRIASRNNGWVWAARIPNDHYDHGHFSFDPVWDEDMSPWLSVLSFKEISMTIDPAGDFTKPLTQGNPGYAGQLRDTGIAFGWEAAAGANTKAASILSQSQSNGSGISALATKVNTLTTKVDTLAAKVDTLATPVVSQEMLNAAMKTALLDPEVHAGLLAASFEGAQQAEGV